MTYRYVCGSAGARCCCHHREKGNGKAIVVGRSGGAVNGLELAAMRPELIDSIIVHEPPVIELLGETQKQRWRSFVNEVNEKNLNEGPDAAQNEFMKSLVNVPFDPYPMDLSERLSGNVDFFFKHELKGFLGYLPKITLSEIAKSI